MKLFHYLQELRRENWFTHDTDTLVVSSMNLKINWKVLDVGCGNGTALKLLKKRDKTLAVFGIDPLQEPIVIAKRNVKGTFCVGMGEKLPWKNRYFDVVMSVLTLHHLNDGKKGFGEMARVLKKSGLLYLCDFAPPPFFRKAMNFIFKIICSANYLYDIVELKKMMSQQGIELLEIKRIKRWWTTLFIGKKS